MLPEIVLEDILSKLPTEELLKCNAVCVLWKDLLTRNSFWKKCYEFRGVKWEEVPSSIKEKPDGWMVLYSHLRYRTFQKNFIINSSGHLEFENWNISLNEGDGWIVEDNPRGCGPLPDDPFFGPNDRSCFVTSFGWCSKSVVIDLWEAGLNPTVMRISLPLQIKCSQMYSPVYDCGAVFRWELRILDSQEKIIRDHKIVIERPPIKQNNIYWETAEYSFKFKQSHADFMNQVRYLVFIHEGRDSRFWKGHYGMKFARSCVTAQPLPEDPELEDEP